MAIGSLSDHELLAREKPPRNKKLEITEILYTVMYVLLMNE